jgi:hypothetical protein
MSKHESTIRTPMTQFESRGGEPTGHVTTNGKVSTIPGLPTRTTGAGQLEEVYYDHNADLPKGPVQGGK